MAMKIIQDTAFKASLSKTGVTVVNFSAPWCAPCKPLLTILNEIDQEYNGSITTLKINVDDSPVTSAEFGVMSMPTVIVFKDSEPVEKLVGLRPKEAYKVLIAKHL
jgi:thioredoxin 1